VYFQGNRKCSFLPGCACLYLYWLTHITCFENKWWWWNDDDITNFYPGDVSRARGDKVGTFWKGCPLKFGTAKKRPKPSAISDSFWLWLRISPERIHKSKIKKVVDQPQPIPRWSKKVGELWSTNEKVTDVDIDPPKCTFFGRMYLCP